MKLTNIVISGLIVLFFTCISCDNQRVFDQYISIPQGGWSKDSIASFDFNITDNQAKYNIYVKVRNTVDYTNANLWLFLDVISPAGQVKRDTVECMLADPRGKWYGSGWGGTYHLSLPFKYNVQFKDSGIYKLMITQGMRHETLKGIKDIGIRVEYSKE